MATRLGKDQLTVRQRKIVEGVIAGKSGRQIGRELSPHQAPSTSSPVISKEIRKPLVAKAINDALDKAGATITKSARVIAEAHDAKDDNEQPDHKVRLSAAELNGRFRKLLSNKHDDEGPLVQVGFFVLKGEAERGIVRE
mgnify:CR=1 FL=1